MMLQLTLVIPRHEHAAVAVCQIVQRTGVVGDVCQVHLQQLDVAHVAPPGRHSAKLVAPPQLQDVNTVSLLHTNAV